MFPTIPMKPVHLNQSIELTFFLVLQEIKFGRAVLLSTVDGGVDLEVGNLWKLGDSPRKSRGKWENPMENMGKTYEKSYFLRENVGNHMGKAIFYEKMWENIWEKPENDRVW